MIMFYDMEVEIMWYEFLISFVLYKNVLCISTQARVLILIIKTVN